MATTLTLSLRGDAPPHFPDRCVGCGGPHQTASALAVSGAAPAAGGTRRRVARRFQVPHCDRCARSTKVVFLAQFLPFALGFLIAGGIGLAGGLYGSHVLGVDVAQTRLGDGPFSLVLAGAAGLLAGIAGGFVFELAGRLVLLPYYGAALWRAPLLVPSLFTDADYVAGLTARPNADVSEVAFVFQREDVAQEFARLNGVSAE